MKSILSTERLYLREFTLEDVSFIIELLNSPGWIQFIGDRNVHSEEDAKKYLLNGPLKSYKENGFGLSMVVRTDNGLPIGMCGLLKRDTLRNPDIGFAFLPEFGGQGYAFEITDALLTFARQNWKAQKISAIALPNNSKSIRLLEKLGFHFESIFRLAPDKEELHLYNILLM